jgi:hypothetical protein
VVKRAERCPECGGFKGDGDVPPGSTVGLVAVSFLLLGVLAGLAFSGPYWAAFREGRVRENPTLTPLPVSK